MQTPYGLRFSRFFLGVLLSAVLVGVSGCYQQETRVVVYPDGSGRIIVTRFFPSVTVRLMNGMQGMHGGFSESMKMEEAFFSEARLKRDARALFGRGVRFVSARRLDMQGGRGSVALYAFDKVDRLSLNPERLSENLSAAMEGFDDDEDDDQDDDDADEAEMDREDTFRFKFAAGSPARLTVLSPRMFQSRASADQAHGMGMEMFEDSMDAMMDDMGGEEIGEYRKMLMSGGNPLKLSGQEPLREIMVKLYQDFRLTLHVELRGASATMAASHPDPVQPGRCLLLGIDGATMARDKTMQGKMGMIMQMGGGHQLARLIGQPGIKAETRPEAVLTFTAPSTVK